LIYEKFLLLLFFCQRIFLIIIEKAVTRVGLPLVKNLHVEVDDYCFFTLVTIAPGFAHAAKARAATPSNAAREIKIFFFILDFLFV